MPEFHSTNQYHLVRVCGHLWYGLFKALSRALSNFLRQITMVRSSFRSIRQIARYAAGHKMIKNFSFLGDRSYSKVANGNICK